MGMSLLSSLLKKIAARQPGPALKKYCVKFRFVELRYVPFLHFNKILSLVESYHNHSLFLACSCVAKEATTTATATMDGSQTRKSAQLMVLRPISTEGAGSGHGYPYYSLVQLVKLINVHLSSLRF